MKVNRVVLSISGALLLQRHDGSGFGEWTRAISNVSRKLDMMCVVTGGGSIAREYIGMAANLNLGREEQDMIGIAVTRVNALLLALSLNWNREVPTTYKDVVSYLKKKKFVVCGGMVPRQSTDKVAADIASMINADIVLNATKVDGVYDKHPGMKDARLIKKLSYDELKSILSGEEQMPGKYALFDLAGIDVLKKNKIPLRIFNGNDVKNLERVIEGKDVGSLVM